MERKVNSNSVRLKWILSEKHEVETRKCTRSDSNDESKRERKKANENDIDRQTDWENGQTKRCKRFYYIDWAV